MKNEYLKYRNLRGRQNTFDKNKITHIKGCVADHRVIGQLPKNRWRVSCKKSIFFLTQYANRPVCRSRITALDLGDTRVYWNKQMLMGACPCEIRSCETPGTRLRDEKRMLQSVWTKCRFFTKKYVNTIQYSFTKRVLFSTQTVKSDEVAYFILFFVHRPAACFSTCIRFCETAVPDTTQ